MDKDFSESGQTEFCPERKLWTAMTKPALNFEQTIQSRQLSGHHETPETAEKLSDHNLATERNLAEVEAQWSLKGIGPWVVYQNKL